MKIYLLTRNESDDRSYDEAWGFIIAAKTPEQARKLVLPQASGDEGCAPWLDKTRSSIEYIGKTRGDMKEGILIRDFNAA